MGIRYCMHCGMPVPRRADFCPECGSSLKEPAPKDYPQQAVPAASPERPEPAGRTRRRNQRTNKAVLYAAAGLTAVCGIIAFFILNVGEKMQYARSRHQENLMEAERAEKKHPEISIPDISIPEIAFPDIQLPEPPAAAFAVESYEIETGLTGETVLYVNLSYTNNAENRECFLTNFKISVQQAGEACRQIACDPARENHITDQVQPDETARISAAFIIQAEQETTVSVAAFLGEGNYLEEIIVPHSDGTVSAGGSTGN